MDRGQTGSDRPRMEDYGSPATDERAAAIGTGRTDDPEDFGGQYSGGTTGTQQGSGEGEQFGEFGNTGTGTDLTIEMESNDVDVRSGLIKGGQSGAADAAGPGQYGGETGEITDNPSPS